MKSLFSSLALAVSLIFIAPQLLPAQSSSEQPPAPPSGVQKDYANVPVNIGFVPPLSVGNIVQMSSGKPIRSNISLHLLCGIGNAVEGIDASALFNVQSDYVNGVQAAGIINIVGGDASWAQGAGVGNIVKGRFSGAQGAGVFNITGGVQGVQGGGAFNISGDVEGAQGAGVFNIGGNLLGVQGAGAVNVAKNVRGLQISGVSNHADDVDGVQISGVLNTARLVTGAQISLINTAHNNEGVMIGLLSFSAAHGIHADLWTDELRFIRLGLRTGNKGFYNLITAGLQPFDGITLWTLGYGLGVQVYVAPKDYLDIGAHAEGVFEGGLGPWSWGVYGTVSRLRFFYGHEFAKNFTVFLGPTLNCGIYTPLGANSREPFPAISEVSLPFGPGSQQFVVSRVWIGVSGGFRF